MKIAPDHLILIRHATPIPHRDQPSSRWPLSREGRADSRRLATLLGLREAHFVASDEDKAVATIHELAGHRPVLTDARFGEVRRPYVDGDYRAVARDYLLGAQPDGWEDQSVVTERFEAAVVDHAGRAAAAGHPLVIGSHGLALTQWLGDHVDLRPDLVAFWDELRMPDVIAVDLSAGTATRPVTG
jgi:broad specificity phosphatase PhoE